MPLPPPPPNLFGYRPPALPNSPLSDSPAPARPVNALNNLLGGLGTARGLPMVRPPMGGIGVLSNLKTSNPNPTPKIPRDLDFGLLYSSYINPPPPKSPLFDSLPLRSSMRHLDTLRTHNVTPAEKEKYNITSDRVMVTSGGNVLNLCGAGVGGRFTTEEVRPNLQPNLHMCAPEIVIGFIFFTNSRRISDPNEQTAVC